ncbi:MAG: glycoside hydrolase family 3 N-terminal domain-containing protein [Candidatus Gastranaerophilaceae bacterium]
MNSLKNKIYQMFVLGMEGPDLNKNPNLIKALQNGLGGVIFFTQNIEKTEQFKNLIKDIKQEAKIPPFLSIDQEGGRVERTENIFGGKKYLIAKFAAQKDGGKGEFLKKQTEQISHDLKTFGINLNFAPVLDVNTNPDNPIIGERAFSDNPDEVIKLGKIVVETYLQNGIIPCVKHFPGHGNANVDSHLSLPKIDLSLAEMEKTHIRPFKEVHAPMVMVAHLHCTAFDKEEIPSSLSKNAVGYLRENLNYKGLIITDDMVMGGVAKTENSPPVQAINAGVNILLYRNSYDETVEIIENLAKLAQIDEELRNNIEASFEKISKFKVSFLR